MNVRPDFKQSHGGQISIEEARLILGLAAPDKQPKQETDSDKVREEQARNHACRL